jgi:hypothetical protein
MRLHLVDTNAELVEAWRVELASFPEIDIVHGDLLAVARHCIVSPANSYGFMDGGIDLVYLRHFGQDLERRVRAAIAMRPERMVPVGAAEVVATGNEAIPFLIVAPGMCAGDGCWVHGLQGGRLPHWLTTARRDRGARWGVSWGCG